MVTIRLSVSEAKTLAMLLDRVAGRVDENIVMRDEAKQLASVVRHSLSQSS